MQSFVTIKQIDQFIATFSQTIIQIGIVIIVGLIATFLINKLLKRLTSAKMNTLPEKKKETLLTVLTSVVRYTVYFLMLYQILKIFKIDTASFLTVAGIGGVALGLGAQNIVRDILAGATFLLEDQFSVGDTIIIKGIYGDVENIGLRSTTIRDQNGNVYIFPNGSIDYITNCTKDFSYAVIRFETHFDEDFDKLYQVLRPLLKKAKQELKSIVEEPKILGIDAMNASSATVLITTKTKSGEQWGVERALRQRIMEEFKKQKLQIAYPRQETIIKKES